jgi:hypothetical protein
MKSNSLLCALCVSVVNRLLDLGRFERLTTDEREEIAG